MNNLIIYNQVALAMAYVNGATRENAKKEALKMPLKDVVECANVIKAMNTTKKKLK